MHKERLAGVFPPVMTPFVREELRVDALRENIDKLNDTELKGYMPLGSNGEFQSLSDDESLTVLRTVRNAMASDKVLIAGVARESAHNTVEFAARCADVGMDYASILAPHYFPARMTDDALMRYYIYVADRCPVPVLLYNAPGFAAGVIISPELVARLALHPNIVGMKDTSKADISTYTEAVPSGAEFYVLAGTITKFFEGLEHGAVGGVLSMANYLPGECCQIHSLHAAGRIQQSMDLSERLKRLNSGGAGKDGVAGVKAAMDLLGYRGLEPRLPLSALPDDQRQELRAAFVAEGLLPR
jgi:4-hydroxy-2-oxoglutarate aldolase